MNTIIKVCDNCKISKEVSADELFCGRCGNRFSSPLTKALDNVNDDDSFVLVDKDGAQEQEGRDEQQNYDTKQQPQPTDTRKRLSLFGEKMKGFGKQVASSAKSTVSSMGETASIVGTNIQGTFAPTSMKREGILWKMQPPSTDPTQQQQQQQVPPPAWIQYYFVFKEGQLHVLPDQFSEKSDISFPIDQIQEIRKVDSLEVGQPNCFQVCIDLKSGQSFKSEFHRATVYSFLGIPILTSSAHHSQSQIVKMVLAAPSEMERDSWVRELKVSVDTLKFRAVATDLGKSTLNLGVRVGAGTLAVVAGSTVGSRAGRKIADAIIK